jgi:branched-chain amino acid transport system ATP-binding protein
MTPLIEARGVTKRFTGFTALSNIDLAVAAGERIGLIGPNGSGKSTLVNCLIGVLPTNGGEVWFEGRNITALPAWRRARMGIARSFQVPRPFRNLTVRANIEVPLRFAAGGHDRRTAGLTVDDILATVGLRDRAEATPRTLTQVELRRLELARALAVQPKILFADEAMAGLSDSELDEILEVLLRLNGEGITIVMIEHIMRAVVRFSRRLVVFVAGEKIADGIPGEVMRMPEVERAYLGQ